MTMLIGNTSLENPSSAIFETIMFLSLSLSQLGGVITPHDGACRTVADSNGAEYDDWITLDYPSIGQIAQALRENDIIPIFAAEARALPVYQVRLNISLSMLHSFVWCM